MPMLFSMKFFKFLRIGIYIGITIFFLGAFYQPAECAVEDLSTPPDLFKDFELLRFQLEKNPKDVAALNSLGIIYARVGRLNDAIILWQRGLAVDSKYIHLYNNLGSALKSLKRFADAERVYRAGLAVSPSYWINYNLGVLEREMGNYVEAARCFQTCLRMNPSFEPAAQKLKDMGLASPNPSAAAHSASENSLPPPILFKPPIERQISETQRNGNQEYGIIPTTPRHEFSGMPGAVFPRDTDIISRPFPSNNVDTKDSVTEEQEISQSPDRPIAKPSRTNVPLSPLTADECAASLAKHPSSISGKVVALTFDDGPHAVLTPQLLQLLKAQGVAATFFVLGSRAETYPDLITRIAAEGHELGNHTWSHHSLVRESSSTGLAELNRTAELMAALTGKSCRLVRPPYGHTNDRVQKMIHSQGWLQIMWDVDSRDWQGGSSNRMLARILKQFSPGSVVLFHDIHPGALKVLPTLITALKKAGYRFVTVSQLAAILNAAS